MTTKSILFKKTSVSYNIAGNGQTVVLLHGFLENKTMWDNIAMVLSNNFRVIAIDLLGHGDTQPLGYIHTMELQAEMVKHVLDKEKITEASFIGHSMGGYIALAFAELFPKRTKGIILQNSTAFEDSLERKENRNRAIEVVKYDASTFISMAIANLFSEENRTKLLDQINETKNQALLTPLQGIIASIEGMKVRKDRAFLWQNDLYPIFLILGKQDPVLDIDQTILQTNKTENVVILDGGHMSHLENSEQLIQTILGFLNVIYPLP